MISCSCRWWLLRCQITMSFFDLRWFWSGPCHQVPELQIVCCRWLLKTTQWLKISCGIIIGFCINGVTKYVKAEIGEISPGGFSSVMHLCGQYFCPCLSVQGSFSWILVLLLPVVVPLGEVTKLSILELIVVLFSSHFLFYFYLHYPSFCLKRNW